MKNKTLLAIAVLCIAMAFGVDYLINSKNIYGNEDFSPCYTTREGSLLQVYLNSEENYRIYKYLSEYPEDFIELILLQEDQRFYNHKGINPISIIRAFVETYFHHSSIIGASTITMQVSKMKYNLYTRTIKGKILQIFYALRLEFLYSKNEILEYYMNKAPGGHNIQGFEAASFFYFNKSVEDLTLTEMLTLCVLPQNPSKRTPYKDNFPKELMDARLRLYERYVQNHKDKEYLQSFVSLPQELNCSFPQGSPHFTRSLYLKHKGKGPCTPIRTTLKKDIDEITRNILELYIKQNSYKGVYNASALLLDTDDMSIVSYVGSASFYDNKILGQVDANISHRSPGSTLKPFVYALAMEQGLIHSHTMLKDAPSSFSEYSPDNYGHNFMGPMKAYSALVQSRNIPAVNLASRIKPDLYDFLTKAKIPLKERDFYGLSIALGTADISPLEEVALYSSLVNHGFMYDINTVFPLKPKKEGVKLLTTESAYITQKMLTMNPPPYRRSRETSYIDIGYKTGTSVGFKDSWSVGFFGQYVLCVWIGNFDGTGNPSFLGRTCAAPLFFNIAQGLISHGFVNQRLPLPPARVQEVKVCTVSGLLPNADCPCTEDAMFIPGLSPITRCKIHRRMNIDTKTGLRTDREGEGIRSVVREVWPSDLMKLFEEAHLPRLSPPPYEDEESRLDISNRGSPPEILSPLNRTEYVFTNQDESRNVIILNAVSDGDSKNLYWFTQDSFIGRTKPGDKFVWKPKAGNYDITVQDDKGRSSSRSIRITSETVD